MRTETIERSLGVSPLAILGLALLAVPRVILHDLGLTDPVVNGVLTFLPLAAWLAVVLWRRVPNAFKTLLTIGVTYGVLLAATHQVLWTESFGDNPPALGGNLAGVLDPAIEGVLFRVFAVFSSVLTGVVVGLITGAVGWLLSRAVPGFRPRGR